MAQKKIGNYIVANGFDVGLKTSHPYYNGWIVATLDGGILGVYEMEELAVILAKGLNKNDWKKCDEEIEHILNDNKS